MLSNLTIENIAIIEYSSIDFENGFNCLTGETGAGKSIIIDAIGAVLGEKTSRDLIRTSAQKAKVTAFFTDISPYTASVIDELGFENETDNSLLISRVMSKDGKNICKVNGKNATVSILKKIGYSLINIHGQSDNQQLMNPDLHFEFIDKLALNGELLNDYRENLDLLYKIRRNIKSITLNESEKERQIDILSFQIDEIEKADIKIGEYDKLIKKKNAFLNSKKIVSALNNAYCLLNGNDDVSGSIRNIFDAFDELNSVSDYGDNIKKYSEAVADCAYQLKDVADELSSAVSDFDYDEKELEFIEDRLDLLYKLKKKYGESEEEIISFYEKIKTDYENITLNDEKINELKEQYEIQYNKTVESAEKLTTSRLKYAEIFAESVKNELEFLNMPGTCLKVNRELCPFNENGIDKIEFLISANKGEEPKPLAKIASGGELARIMLAIKNVLSDRDYVATLIFDEIDTGVSGNAAGKIGEKLYAVSKNHQVICITHLPTIAAFADTHLKISKSTIDDITRTNVEMLDKKGSIAEISRIISGNEYDEIQLNAVKHLVEDTIKIKEKYR